MGIAFGDVLRIGDVIDVLQLADGRILGHGVDEEPDRILLVDVELPHEEVGEVVEPVRRPRVISGACDLRRREHLARELRMLIGKIGHKTVLALHDAESRADALRQIARIGGLRQARVGFDTGRVEAARRRHVDPFVALLIIVGHTVLQTQLRILRHGFGVGHVAAQIVTGRGCMRMLITQPQRILGHDDQLGCNAPRLIRIAVCVPLVVAVTHAPVERQRTSGFAQFRAIGEVLV